MPGEPGQHQPERDRAQQIADDAAMTGMVMLEFRPGRGGQGEGRSRTRVRDPMPPSPAMGERGDPAGTDGWVRAVPRRRSCRLTLPRKIVRPSTIGAARRGPAPGGRRTARSSISSGTRRSGRARPRPGRTARDRPARPAPAARPASAQDAAGLPGQPRAARRAGSDAGCDRARATAAAASPARRSRRLAELNGRRFESWSHGAWSLAIASIVPSREPGDHRLAVAFAAQRRRQFGEGAVVADRGLVQGEIGRGGVAGDRQPAAPWPGGSPRSPPAVERWAA